MSFGELRLIEPLLRAVASEGYTTPTPIQTQAIPHVLEGRDLLGCAQTGTGKTAAFALPILQLLHAEAAAAPRHDARHEGKGGGRRRPIRTLVLTPTRELAAQIGESFGVYGRHTGMRHTVIFGGVGQGAQAQALRNGVDVLVATPGRLLDLMNQGLLSLAEVRIFVLDEADRMLDMGFIHDIRRVMARLPVKRQTLMFSATMPGEIRVLADTILRNPVEVKVPSVSMAADTVAQVLYHVDKGNKLPLLEQLLAGADMGRTLVFTRTKHGADKVARRLAHAGIAAEAIHSNKSQNARTRALASFKNGATRVLVASDIASRGLDVDDISHVVNFDMPHEPETYVHRIGRTGRAGAAGQAISFCSDDERDDLKSIERLLGKRIPVLRHHMKPLPVGDSAAGQGGPSGYGHRGRGDGAPAGAPHPKHVTPHTQGAGGAGTPATPPKHVTPHTPHAPHTPHTPSAAPAHRKSASPEQQQTAFWKGKRKQSGNYPSGPRRGRGGHR